jgi:GT2 family glycosyltransferase
MTSIAVIIINYNTRESLRACLATVVSQDPAETIVVDNSSHDSSVEMVRAEYPQVVLHANKSNVGYGTAANQGVASSKADYVLVLNADTVLTPGTLQALKNYLDDYPQAAAVGPRLVRPNGQQRISCHPFPTPFFTLLEITCLSRLVGRIPILRDWYLCTWAHDRPRIVPWVSGAAMAIRREAFSVVGGFDESFFMYTEEVDLCYRLKLAGRDVHFAPVATIVHAGAASTVQHRAEMKVQLFASIVHFYQKHYSKARIAELVAILKAVMLVRLARDMLRLAVTHDPRKRDMLNQDMNAWRHVLAGNWQVGPRIADLKTRGRLA